MKISLAEVMNLKDTAKEADIPIEADVFEYDGVEYPFISKEPVHLRISRLSPKSLRFLARTKCALKAECSRCLEEVELPFDIDVEYELIQDENGRACTSDDDEKLSYVADNELDIEGFIREELMIGFPLKVLCSEDCRGICPVCGRNLNLGECGCDRTVLDPRMSIIKDLFLNDKEV